MNKVGYAVVRAALAEITDSRPWNPRFCPVASFTNANDDGMRISCPSVPFSSHLARQWRQVNPAALRRRITCIPIVGIRSVAEGGGELR